MDAMAGFRGKVVGFFQVRAQDATTQVKKSLLVNVD